MVHGVMTDWFISVQNGITHTIGAGWFAFCIYLILGWIASFATGRLLNRVTLRKRGHAQVFSLVTKAIKGIIWALVLVQALRAVGVDVVGILGAAGVAGVAIGFASQTALSNLISGVFLVGESSFKMGDYIKVGSEEGTVESINLLSVYLRRADNTLARVPCEMLIKTPVRNLTGAAMRRIDFDLGVDYSSDLMQVKEIISQVIEKQPKLLDTPAPSIIFGGFGACSLDLHIGAWCKTEHYHEVRYAFATALLAAFAEHGISIPFPIRAVTPYAAPLQAPSSSAASSSASSGSGASSTT